MSTAHSMESENATPGIASADFRVGYNIGVMVGAIVAYVSVYLAKLL